MSKPSSRPQPSNLVRCPRVLDPLISKAACDRQDEYELVGFLYAKEQITDEIDELDERRDQSAISSGGVDRRSRRHGVELKPAAIVQAEQAARVQTTEAAEPSQPSETQQPPTSPQTTTPQPPLATPEHQHTHDPNTEEVDDHEDEEQQGDSEERHDDHEEQERDSEDQEGSEEQGHEDEQEQQGEQGQQEALTADEQAFTHQQGAQDGASQAYVPLSLIPALPARSPGPSVFPLDPARIEGLRFYVHSVDQLFYKGIWLCGFCGYQSVRGASIQQGGEAKFWFQRPACCPQCQRSAHVAYTKAAPVFVYPYGEVLDYSQYPPVYLTEEGIEARREHIVNLAK
ncbi:unnamed protein product [Vitrella brassicaformis CCMP3155]|uniref:Uncharacterized protein n=1 Tax=Vitrella brassicaformis (strain CCMP3155) TaxID=1169540 RepID=A0A0G4GUP5_VITBC|nr:unnamed protein product [Vitrella brassicaformis CCMP3155]|eukprot:CEM34539.1 unnamed protein product [Vitrella brassicaformis CCMP3155]